MNKRLVTLMVAALALLSASGQVNFAHVGQYHVIEVTPEKSTGLDKIYVLFDTDGVEMSYNSLTGERAKWESFYYHDGSLVMETVPGVRWNGMATTLDKIIPNMGYKIQEGNNHPFYCWVVNYADYYASLKGITWGSGASCSIVSFSLDGHADAIPYYTTSGIRQVLDREIKLTYNNKVWDDSLHWQDQVMVESFPALDQAFSIDPPICDTWFELTGDRFLEEWGLGQRYVTDIYHTHAVSCGATAEQEDRGYDNERGLDNGLGGSAPVHIVFTGYPSEAVVFRVWEMADDEDFENVILQYNQDEVDYVFNEAGTYFMRYRVANEDGSCEDYSETFRINVSESELVCPNIFSPGSTEGVNDVWKVSYKSLVEFHCWIYNRWGTLVYEFTDPGQGWDGTYKGRLVDTGVYYYVIIAKGGDGVNYKKRGDINILRYTRGAGGTSGNGSGGMDTGGL